MSGAPSVLHVVNTAARVGVASIVSLLARGLAAEGFAVRVIALSQGPLIDDLVRAGIPTAVIPVDRPFDPASIVAIARDLRRSPVDVVHTHGPRAMVPGNLAARFTGTPAVVTTFHEMSGVKATTSRHHRLYAGVEGWLARWCTDACVVPSEPLVDDAVRGRGVPRAKIAVIHNAIDPARFHRVEDAAALAGFRARLGIAPEDRVIGAVGSLVPVKAHDDLVRALARVRVRCPRARLVIAGTGPERGALAALAASEGVGEHLILAEDVSELGLLYGSFDVFALASTSEATPLVLLEAIFCGVPVVSTPVGVAPELVVPDGTGLLVPIHDPGALADAIVRLLEDRALSARLAAAALERANERVSAERFLRGHAELYARLLERRR